MFVLAYIVYAVYGQTETFFSSTEFLGYIRVTVYIICGVFSGNQLTSSRKSIAQKYFSVKLSLFCYGISCITDIKHPDCLCLVMLPVSPVLPV
jgi:hypothetical protein